MLRRLGYVAIALSIDASTNRSCRLRNATPELLRDLIRRNLEGLRDVLQYNLQQGIFLYRISSQIIPFASHPVNQIPWWDEFEAQLAQLGQFIARHRFRVSMHPGQFTVLSSPDPEVVAASLAEVGWHVRFLDCLGTDAGNKIVIHGGGAYGDRGRAADRFVQNVRGMPESWRCRLVLENDERVYAAEDVLGIAAACNIPVVFDWLHHRANPGPDADISRLIARCFDSWGTGDGVPKVHLSSQVVGGRPGQHADWIDPQDFEALLAATPAGPFDCMLEAKRKDQALLKLRHDLRLRGIVEGNGSGSAE